MNKGYGVVCFPLKRRSQRTLQGETTITFPTVCYKQKRSLYATRYTCR